MKIYSEYEDEPEDVFYALDEKHYCDLYELEMDGYSADIDFYKRNLPPDHSLLEIGCGTGRVTRALSGKNRTITGIDISLPMIKKASGKNIPGSSFVCMDMRKLAFSTSFTTIIIPYNSLNLLAKKDDIVSCLKSCRAHLKKNGTIRLQLFIPDMKLKSHKGRTFQFQMFDRPGGGKIIKEILKDFSTNAQTVLIEERYRIRPTKEGHDNQNLHHFYKIAGFAYDEWVSLFRQVGLHITHSWGDYDLTPFHHHNSSCLLAILTSL